MYFVPMQADWVETGVNFWIVGNKEGAVVLASTQKNTVSDRACERIMMVAELDQSELEEALLAEKK